MGVDWLRHWPGMDNNIMRCEWAVIAQSDERGYITPWCPISFSLLFPSSILSSHFFHHAWFIILDFFHSPPPLHCPQKARLLPALQECRHVWTAMPPFARNDLTVWVAVRWDLSNSIRTPSTGVSHSTKQWQVNVSPPTFLGNAVLSSARHLSILMKLTYSLLT